MNVFTVSRRRTLCLLACGFFYAALAAAADPASISAELAGEYGSVIDSDDLTAALSRRLQRVPRLDYPSQLFQQSMSAPLAFDAHLLGFAAQTRQTLVEKEKAAPALLRLMSDQYGQQFSCNVRSLVLPASLDQALDQIEVLAVAVQARQQDALTARQRSRLARDFSAVSSSLLHPQPSTMSWWERRRLRRFLEILSDAEAADLHCASAQWLQLLEASWLRQVQQLMARHPRAEQQIIVQRTTALGRIIFGGQGHGRYFGSDILAIIELGGDDFFGIESTPDFQATPFLLVDFSGDDSYHSTGAVGVAAGIGNVSLLRDYAGDDRYQAQTWAQGAALLGFGLLQDLAGDDLYRSQFLSQGVALQGLALLQDLTGKDDYQLQALGQGLGLSQGLAMLVDGSGNDRYFALGGRPSLYGTAGLTDAWAQGVGLGLRGLATGGIGVLLDGAGADVYDAGNFSQGGGYYRGVGQLLDLGAGSDRFHGSRYSLAWGAHGGVAYLLNEQGDDQYMTRHSVMAGIAWDYSLALFHDQSGADDYRAGDFSLGAAAYGSVGWFVDSAGNDSFSGTIPARWNEGAPNFALFWDAEAASSGAIGCRYSETYGFRVVGSPLDLGSCQAVAQ